MPNRVIRDGWIDSPKIEQLSPQGEVFFLRLCLRADDYGCYTGNLSLLKSYLYPLKSTVRNTNISHWMTECQKAGLIAVHTIPGKDSVIEIFGFDQRLRIKKPKFIIPHTMTDRCQTDVRQMSDTCRLESESESEVEVEKKKKMKSITDEEWLTSLQESTAYKNIDVRKELDKCIKYFEVKDITVSRQRFLNWLNKAERPMTKSGYIPDNILQKINI